LTAWDSTLHSWYLYLDKAGEMKLHNLLRWIVISCALHTNLFAQTPPLFFGGNPQLDQQACSDYKILENKGYRIGYCEDQNIALWVMYRLFEVADIKSPEKRPPYVDDERTDVYLPSDFYGRTGFDAGHLAPNAGIYNRYGREGQLQTFLLSNFGPQKPRLNRGPWRSLEYLAHKNYAQKFREIWVMCGPVLKEGLPKLKGTLPIPEHYYKILVDLDGESIRTMAFLMPNADTMNTPLDFYFNPDMKEDYFSDIDGIEKSPEFQIMKISELKHFLHSIDEVEEATGLDFLSRVKDEYEDQVEAYKPSDIWNHQLPKSDTPYQDASFSILYKKDYLQH